CWCGNAWTAGAVPAPAADCKMPCNDNSTEYCGGPARLNAYKYQPTEESTATATSMDHLSSTTIPSTPSPTAPHRRAKVGDWVYQGCWTEATRRHALADGTYASDGMTLDSCASFCDGKTYFGVEYGRECYCGHVLQPGSVQAINQADCSFLCPGDKTQYCGAGRRLELYKIGNATQDSYTSPAPQSPTPTAASSFALTTPLTAATSTWFASSSVGAASDVVTSSTLESVSNRSRPAVFSSRGPVISNGNANFTYLACISEPSRGRILATQLLNHVNMTIDMCLRACWQYAYAGVEYHRECWCGNILNYAGHGAATRPGKKVADSDCDFSCAGNKTESCGSTAHLSVYARKKAAAMGP
ncbi:hypothetical protein E4U53_004607, partial [Claviceps sorghi]